MYLVQVIYLNIVWFFKKKNHIITQVGRLEIEKKTGLTALSIKLVFFLLKKSFTEHSLLGVLQMKKCKYIKLMKIDIKWIYLNLISPVDLVHGFIKNQITVKLVRISNYIYKLDIH